MNRLAGYRASIFDDPGISNIGQRNDAGSSQETDGDPVLSS
jgi:hypothetical protein